MFIDWLKQHSRKPAKRFAYVAGALGLWFVVGWFGLISNPVWQGISLWITVLLFILGLPLSLFLRVDNFEHFLGTDNQLSILCLAAAVVFLNFLLIAWISALRGSKNTDQGKSAGEALNFLNNDD